MLIVNEINGALGAEVSGVDLSSPLEAGVADEIMQALNEHKVLFFRGQKQLTIDEHIALGSNFGTVDTPLFPTPSSPNPKILTLDQTDPKGAGADNFHSDNSFRAAPTLGSILQAQIMPKSGGDTCWASMSAVFEALSPQMQNFLEGLTAVHTLEMMAVKVKNAGANLRVDPKEWPPRSHPVVVTHPRTGEKLLYVNKNWTSHIEGLSEQEGKLLLDFLLNHTMRPEFHVRIKWNPGDVVFWDNIACCHYAVPDYSTRRVMQRVAIQGPEITGTMPGKNL